jgi:hypothetical protein
VRSRVPLRVALLPLAGLALLTPVVAVRTAAGEEGREAVRLEYTSAPGCPDRARFEALVVGRTARAAFVSSDATRTFEVSLHAGDRPGGRLTVRRGSAIEGSRDVSADSCADVANALALVAALAIDPALLVSPDVAAAAGNAALAGSAAPVQSSAPAPVASAPPSPPPPPPPPPSAEPPLLPARPVERQSPSGPLPLAFFGGVQLVVAVGITPATLVGAAPMLGGRSERQSLFAPSVVVSFVHATTGALAVQGGEASFEWNAGRVDGCALSWPRGALRLTGCLTLEAGDLLASGTQVAHPQSSIRGWFSFGPLIKAEWHVLPPLFLGAEAAAMVHPVADHFIFLPDVTVYDVPYVAFEGGAMLGVHFL